MVAHGNYTTGTWVDGLLNGKGVTREIETGKIVYEGDFVNGKYHGNGFLAMVEYEYEGEFENGQINGRGKIVYANGKVEEGVFFNGPNLYKK